MGRKQRQACLSLRFFVTIPILIVLFPYEGLLELVREGWCWTTATAETVFINGVIWTGDPDMPWGHSMAVSRGRILRVGSLIEVQAIANKQTQYFDLKGQFVTPGFVDSHVHFIPGGIEMIYLDFRNVSSRIEFVSKIESRVQVCHMEAFENLENLDVQEGRWIFGSGWDQENWGGELPEASWIDNITPNNPVWIIRIDGHMALCNLVAMKMAGLEAITNDPDGGIIMRGKDGAPTGVLIDAAMTLVRGLLPRPSLQDRREAFVRATNHALSMGVTSVVDFGSYYPGVSAELSWNDFQDVYLWADAEGIIRTRVYTFFPLETWCRLVQFIKERGRILSQWLRIGGVKAFADGSVGSSTARFHEADLWMPVQPYADDTSNYGLHIADPDWLLEAVINADKASLQVAIHAIGDAANDQVLMVIEALKMKNGPWDRRFRMEHVQHLSLGGPLRVAVSGAVASVQPMHLIDDAKSAAKRLGEERSSRSYLFRSLLGNGTKLALGSDWTVSPLDPLMGMQAAWKRTPDGWKMPWLKSECLPIEAALRGYTTDGAYAAFMENDVGSLTPGKFADFVVLSHNLLSESTAAVPHVLSTYVGGLLQYSAFSATTQDR